MNTRLLFDECDNGRYVVYLKELSEKPACNLQSDETENERR